MTAWNPDRYLAYSDERGRPFVDLLARVRADDPRAVVDLGCGPGNLTAIAAARWPGARTVGLDSSVPMIDKACASVTDVDFGVADVRDWADSAAPGSVDLLLSNATFQWVPGHLDLLPSLAAKVAPGGTFAFQVPGNFDEPSHVLREELSAEEPYATHTRDLERPGSHDPAVYYAALVDNGFEVDAWETTYLHVLTGEDPVFTWISGTSLRPTAAALEKAGVFDEYAAELKRRLAAAYPAKDGRVLLPFRRVFVVARKEA